MKKYILLPTLVSAGSLLFLLTVGAQSNDHEDSLPEQSTSTLTAPVENDAPPSSAPSDQPHPAEPPAAASAVVSPAEQHQTLVSIATVVGVGVKNAQGETIGEIQEIMIDPETGRVAYAMVTYSGQWGMGKQKSFAVPWEALKIAFNQTDLVVELESDKLSIPPHIELSRR